MTMTQDLKAPMKISLEQAVLGTILFNSRQFQPRLVFAVIRASCPGCPPANLQVHGENCEDSRRNCAGRPASFRISRFASNIRQREVSERLNTWFIADKRESAEGRV